MSQHVEHPGNWFSFLKRDNNNKLNTLEAKSKYYKEQLLYENFVSSIIQQQQVLANRNQFGGPNLRSNFVSFTPTTKTELQTAVDLWVSDNAQALITYGEINTWVTTNITDMSALFANSNFNSNISNWDVGNVTTMYAMFFTNPSFNQPIEDWDVSNVISMNEMFGSGDPSQYSTFDQPLNNWDVSSVTNMRYMFGRAYTFNQPLNNWDVSSVTNMEQMFFDATSFNQDLSSWSVSNVTDYLNFDDNTSSWVLLKPYFGQGYLFSSKLELQTAVDLWVSNEAQAITLYGEINTWNVSAITDFDSLFLSKATFNSNISNWNMSNALTTRNMFNNATAFSQPIGSWNMSKVNNMQGIFQFATVFNQPLNNWDVSRVSGVAGMRNTFQFAAAFNQPLNNWDVSNVTDMQFMFFADPSQGGSVYNQDLSSWDVSNVTDATNFDTGATAWVLPKPNFV